MEDQVSTQTQTTRTTWTIDPAHTQVEFSARHMMITRVRGRFAGVEGQLIIDEERPEASEVEVRIATASIDTRSEDRDAHLRSEDFLHVDEHPEITFRSKRIEGAHLETGDTFRVVGDLTIRGETREVVLQAQVEGTGQDPWGGRRAGFSATAEVDRRDFGLTWNQALETGGVLVSNSIAIELQVQVVQRSAEHEG